MTDEVGGDQPSTGAGETATPQVALANVTTVSNYVKRVVTALLEDDSVVHPALEKALSDESAIERIRKFISDSQVKALLVQRSAIKGWLMV